MTPQTQPSINAPNAPSASLLLSVNTEGFFLRVRWAEGQMFRADADLCPLPAPPPSRCCQSHRAAGEAAGVGRRPRTQAAVPEEGAPERVLHRHQRGESPAPTLTLTPPGGHPQASLPVFPAVFGFCHLWVSKNRRFCNKNDKQKQLRPTADCSLVELALMASEALTRSASEEAPVSRLTSRDSETVRQRRPTASLTVPSWI